ncbi:phosphatase PAP2 family protein [Lactiplantibacillus daowaiensis]|uniref:Phosphatase PAP2 family protein n=1 Tax=Lactiplantibacillus daowaiensis TaxID=2559918 RepID=A0ABW1RWQ3_9LACO|nr:phosphatase PAP2 family protein [Lactiplantibacillus daowaiensis]
MTRHKWRPLDFWMLGLTAFWFFWTGLVAQPAQFIHDFDQAIALPLHHSPQWFQQLMVGYTQLGNPHNLTIITLVLGLGLLMLKQPRATIFLWINTWIFGGYGNYFVKQIIQRPRPTAWRLVQIGGYSYPSGHSTSTTLLIGSLIVIAWDLWPNRYRLKRWLLGIGASLVGLMMVSRIIVGVHYPSDTVGGLILGCCLLYLSVRLTTGRRTGPLNYQSTHQNSSKE